MNLTYFAGALTLDKPSEKVAKEILPSPAPAPKKSIQPLLVKPLYNIRDVYVKADELYKEFELEWGAIGTSKGITDAQMKINAIEYLDYYLKNKEEKNYIEIVSADTSRFKFRFKIEKWLYDNFNSKTPYYQPIATLAFECKIPVPLFFRDNTNWVEKFIVERFESFMSSRKTKLLNSNISFLKTIDTKMFEYQFDYRLGVTGGIRAVLRHTVIMGALALYTATYFKKNISKDQEKKIQSSTSRFSNVDNLNRFLRNLK